MEECVENYFAHMQGKMRSPQEDRDVKSKQEVSKQISVTLEHQREMPEHFINHSERVEQVWQLLQKQGSPVVALVGMGGIGRPYLLLSVLWYPQLQHFQAF